MVTLTLIQASWKQRSGNRLVWLIDGPIDIGMGALCITSHFCRVILSSFKSFKRFRADAKFHTLNQIDFSITLVPAS